MSPHEEQMEAARKDFAEIWDRQVHVFMQFCPLLDMPVRDRERAIFAAKQVAWNSYLSGMGITRRNHRIADEGATEGGTDQK